MTDFIQTPYGTLVTVTITLDALANNARAISAALGSDAPPSGNEAPLLADFELVVDYATNPTALTPIDCYIVRAVDGTNYVDGDASNAPAPQNYVGSFVVRATTSPMRLGLYDVPLPPGLFKVVIHNNGTGQAFSTGCSLKYRPHSVRAV